MTHEELRRLISTGETLTVEFKRDAPLSDDEFAEAVVCLANTEGGVLLLGVEDDGVVSGLHTHHLPAAPRAIEAMIANKTVPSVRPSVELHQLTEGVVAVVQVEKARGVIQTSDGRTVHRFWAGRGEPECRPMRPNEVTSRWAHLGVFDLSAQVLEDATWDELNPLEFERLRQTLKQRPRSDASLAESSDETLARALGLAELKSGQLLPTVAGMLLVGHLEPLRRCVPTHEAAFQILGPRLRVELNEFYREPLVQLFQRFEQLLDAQNVEQEFHLGIQRIAIPRFPKDAFREAVANALVHRDYSLNYAVHVKIDPTEGGLLVSSPGGFVEGINLHNLLVAGPRARNRTLADAFKRLGLVERTGRGVERIFEQVLETGRPAPSYAGSSSSEVRVLLPDRDADLAFVRMIIEVRDREQRSFDWRQLLILRQASDEGELTTSEVAELIQRDAAYARILLEELVELGLLESKGPKRSRSYHLSAGAFERLGRKRSYVRRRGLDELMRRQLVRAHLEAYGRITRAEVADLCQITPRQAEYLLRKMREEGEILPAPGRERGKYAFYVPRTPE